MGPDARCFTPQQTTATHKPLSSFFHSMNSILLLILNSTGSARGSGWIRGTIEASLQCIMQFLGRSWLLCRCFNATELIFIFAVEMDSIVCIWQHREARLFWWYFFINVVLFHGEGDEDWRHWLRWKHLSSLGLLFCSWNCSICPYCLGSITRLSIECARRHSASFGCDCWQRENSQMAAACWLRSKHREQEGANCPRHR